MRLPSSPDTRWRLMAGLWHRTGVQSACTIPSYKGNLPCAINVTIPIKSIHALRTRREVLKAGAALVAAPFLGEVTSIVQSAHAANTRMPVGRPAHARAGKVRGAATEWLNYAGDKASSKYSLLTQISGGNFNRLRTAWTWRSAEEEVAKANHLKTWVWEATPLMVGGVLYMSTSLSQVAAIDAATGKTRWVYDPETWKGGTPSNNGFVHRGVAYWADGNDQRILFGTGDGYLICLSAQTGKPISTFGQQGRIDLTQGLGRTVDRHLYGLACPPIICRDVVMGSK